MAHRRGRNAAGMAAMVVYPNRAVIAYAFNKAEDIAHMLGVTAETAIRWASRFHESGVDGLRDKLKGHREQKLPNSNREIIRA